LYSRTTAILEDTALFRVNGTAVLHSLYCGTSGWLCQRL